MMIEVYPILDGMDKDDYHHLAIQNLIVNFNVRRLAEVGVFKGRTMRKVLRSPEMASRIDQWFGVDPWLPNKNAYRGLGGINKWDGYYAGVCKYMPWFPALRLLRMQSVVAAPLFPDGYFDLVYIDGDHNNDAVANDIRAWMPKVKKGGVIGGHDFDGMGGAVSAVYNVATGVRAVFGEDFERAKCSVWYKVLA